MGLETLVIALIIGGFAAFVIFIGFVDVIANERAITPEQELAARAAAQPVSVRVAAKQQLKRAA